MTMRFSANNAVTSSDTGPQVIWYFLNFMTTASPGGPGWTLKSGYNDTGGTSFTGPADLDGYIANQTPWFVIQDPAGGREILVCRDNATDGEEWRFYYSVSAGFTGGASGTLPTATDQELIGGGAGAEICSTVNQYAQYGADDASPYGFFFFSYDHPALTPTGGFAMVPIDAQAPNETDPVVFVFMEVLGASTWTYQFLSRGVNIASYTVNAKCVGFMPGTSTFQSVAAMVLADTSTGGGATTHRVPNSSGQDNNSEDNPIPIIFLRQSGLTAPTGYKGVTNFMQWKANNRANLSTYDTLNYIQIGDVIFPWDGSTVPLV